MLALRNLDLRSETTVVSFKFRQDRNCSLQAA
jgi:hypothetical protein